MRVSHHNFTSFLVALLLLGGGWRQGLAAVPSDLVEELSATVDEALGAEVAEARAWALRARALLGERASRQLLLDNSQNTDLLVRIFCGLGLAEMGRPEGLEILAEETVAAGAASRQRILDRYLRHLPERQQVTVLTEVLTRMEDPQGLADVLRWIARNGEGAVYQLLAGATRLEEDTAELYLQAVLSTPRPEAIELARSLAGSSLANLRRGAVEVAQMVGGEQGQAMLEELLASPSPETAEAAAFALAPLGVSAAYTTLLEVAQNPESTTRVQALEAIRDGNPSLLRLETLSFMVTGEQDLTLRRRIYEALGATGSDQAYQELEAMLSRDIYEQRLDAIAGLGYTHRASAVPLLAEVLLGGGGPELRRLAAEALGHLGIESAAEPLLTALNRERGGEVMLAVVRALGFCRSPEAVWPVAFLLSNSDDAVVLAALDTLEALDASSVASQVETTATSHRSPEVRWQATLALLSLDPQVGQIRLMQAIERPPEGFMAAIERLPQGLRMDLYRRLLRQANPDVRALTASRLLAMREQGLPLLTEMIDPASPSDMRQLAVSLVTARRDPQDLSLFLELAETSQQEMRNQALQAIVELASPDCEPMLRSLLESPDLVRRVMAVYGLWKMAQH